jgi:XTP/dITP diphosphohydrolase
MVTSVRPPTLLVGSTNPGKLEELYDLLRELAVAATDPGEIGLRLEVVEDGETYAENACLKARAFAEASSMPSLADDTGLEVAALGGRPGLRSRRLAGSDEERRCRLLEMLSPLPRPWEATFRCAMALALPTGAVFVAHGACAGEIIPLARGEGGFGYDPIFQLRETDRTMAELPMPEKNRLSHRARAFRALTPDLMASIHLR